MLPAHSTVQHSTGGWSLKKYLYPTQCLTEVRRQLIFEIVNKQTFKIGRRKIRTAKLEGEKFGQLNCPASF